MSTRICVVGNSHVGAFKRGWNELQKDYPDIHVDLFGAPGSSIADFKVADGYVIAGEGLAAESFIATGGSDRFRLSDYSAVVVVGCGGRLMQFTNLLKTYQPPFMNSLLGNGLPVDFDDLGSLVVAPAFGSDLKPTPVSNALMVELIKGRVRRSAAFELVNAISAQDAGPVFYAPTPLPSSEILVSRPKNSVSRVVQQGFGQPFATLLWRAFEDLMRGKAQVVRPSEDVVVSSILTDKRFSTDSVRLNEGDGAHDDEDLMHMNGEYGAIMLRLILSRIAKPLAA